MACHCVVAVRFRGTTDILLITVGALSKCTKQTSIIVDTTGFFCMTCTHLMQISQYKSSNFFHRTCFAFFIRARMERHFCTNRRVCCAREGLRSFTLAQMPGRANSYMRNPLCTSHIHNKRSTGG